MLCEQHVLTETAGAGAIRRKKAARDDMNISRLTERT